MIRAPLSEPSLGWLAGRVEPQRWDVIVFKFPGGATQNYIKRLIGLPNERIRIVGGNIYTCELNAPDEAFRVAEPPRKLNAMLQLVDDTDHLPQELSQIGWPSRWQPWPATSSAWRIRRRAAGNSRWRRTRPAATKAKPGSATGISCRRTMTGCR